MESIKKCTKCRLDKPYSEFRIDSRIKSGLRSQCKSCDCSYAKEYYPKIRNTVLKRIKEWRLKNKDKLNAIIECNLCFKKYMYKNKALHLRSKRHKRGIERESKFSICVGCKVEKNLNQFWYDKRSKEIIACVDCFDINKVRTG